MKPSTVYVIVNPASGDVLDIAFHLGMAQHRALDRIKEAANEIYWAVTTAGHMGAYSLDGERVLVEIIKYQAEFWEEIIREATE